MKRLLLFTLTMCLLSGLSTAQKKPSFGKQPKGASKAKLRKTYGDPKLDRSDIDWKANRLEFVAGAGGSSFLGELGGQDSPGKPFVYDLEPTQARYSLSLGARYFVREYHALRGALSYARLRGADATTSYPNRRYRNLNFKSPIVELSGSYEFYILQPKYLHFAGGRTTKVFRGNRFGLYTSVGAGLFFFNPKGQYQGEWYSLKPLSTEGQGLPGGPSPYKRVSVAFPLGGGITYLLNHNYKIGLDFGYRWTLTDYIDDAGGYYYDNEVIVEEKGKLAGLMANPSVLLGGEVPNSDWYTAGQPRGGQESNDTYLFLQVTLSHAFTPSISNKEFKPKKRRKAGSYDSDRSSRKNKRQRNQSYKNKRIKNEKRKFKSPNLNFGKRKKRNKIRTF